MVKYHHGQLLTEVLALLQQRGPLTRGEIAAELHISRQLSGAVISRLNRSSPERTKRIYVKAWCWHAEGERTYPRPIYDVCDTIERLDAPRPSSPDEEL